MGALSLVEFMKQRPDGTLESIAEQYGATLLSVVRSIPGSVVVGGGHFDTVWNVVSGWGKVTTVVHTNDVILEFTGALPDGFYQQGYFNLREQNGFSGHIKAQNCQHIAFLERKFMGMDTASVVFFNAAEEAMLKFFVGRDNHRNLRADQLAGFRSLSLLLKS